MKKRSRVSTPSETRLLHRMSMPKPAESPRMIGLRPRRATLLTAQNIAKRCESGRPRAAARNAQHSMRVNANTVENWVAMIGPIQSGIAVP